MLSCYIKLKLMFQKRVANMVSKEVVLLPVAL
jgi:hypothetical protein